MSIEITYHTHFWINMSFVLKFIIINIISTKAYFTYRKISKATADFSHSVPYTLQ